MRKNLADFLLNGRDNNFNLLRLFAATVVIVGHTIMLTSDSHLKFRGFSLASLGPDIFFIISGFLVCKSWCASRSPYDYIRARFFRIWPGLCLSSLIICILYIPITTVSFTDYFKSAIGFLYATFILNIPGDYVLKGVFSGSAYPQFNCALWTLNYEVSMYALLGLIGMLGFMQSPKKRWALLVIYLVFFSLSGFWINNLSSEVSKSLLRFSMLFIIGMYFYHLRGAIALNYYGLGVAILVMIVGLSVPLALFNFHMLLCGIALGYIIFWFAYIPAGFIRRFNLLGDYSYGLYIYGWPVIKGVSLHVSDPWIVALLSWCLSLIFAVLSWMWVEKPILGYYRESRKRLLNPEKLELSYDTKVMAILIFASILFLAIIPEVNVPVWHASMPHGQ